MLRDQAICLGKALLEISDGSIVQETNHSSCRLHSASCKGRSELYALSIKADRQDQLKGQWPQNRRLLFSTLLNSFRLYLHKKPPGPNTVLDTKTTGLIYLNHVTSKPIP